MITYRAFFADGTSWEIRAYEHDQAEYIAANLSALHNRGGVKAVVFGSHGFGATA
jgi:hypothetical protein